MILIATNSATTNTVPSSDQILNNLNNGKSYTFHSLINHWVDGLNAGYQDFIMIAAGVTIIILCIGILITILGFLFQSSGMKKGGIGTSIFSVIGFGLMVLAPTIVKMMQHNVLP